MEAFTSGLLALEQAQQRMLALVSPLAQTEIVSLEQAAGRITATDITSPLDVPAFANAAMDGYAVRMADLAPGDALLPVAGKAFAGNPFVGDWPAGSCIRIMTGAPIPPGTEAVIMQEYAEAEANGVRFTHPVKAGQNIRLAGEDIQRGARVLPAGSALGPARLPLLASLGVAEVTVIRRLRVALFSTGDELQHIGQPLQAGQIYDTNRFAVRLMLEKLGCDILDLGIIRDDPVALRDAFQRADSEADLVISSGGVSVEKLITPSRFWMILVTSIFGSWRSSPASRSPSANCVRPGSAACPVIRFLLPSPSINWCNRSSRSFPATASGTSRHVSG